MKEHSGKRIGQDGRKCAHRAGLARCVGRRLAEGGAAAERGRAWRLGGEGASGCDRIGQSLYVVGRHRQRPPAVAVARAQPRAAFRVFSFSVCKAGREIGAFWLVVLRR